MDFTHLNDKLMGRCIKLCVRGRIVTSVMENIARIASVLNHIYMTPQDCTALDLAGTTTDFTLEQQIQTVHPQIEWLSFMPCTYFCFLDLSFFSLSGVSGPNF